ncbi:NAD-dependent epimerase/dehydratase family protein [Dickeya fangzhongdai]|uniref:NAD-dependent epimerase/dehydratase family protein n=1 Tax=Dickeya fangzhongdai TaxID=1778540 RepID=UPI0004F80AC4|nr:NAD-dependent epimerase/dehydratase family protein [Dickeya fangzhongdai]AIR71130.1 diaminohydroxyphosphoribosylaminopyrimidine deaminase [Dickeya fangzhongdai]KGT96793.1 diaminohydroxyphosphoribosylaminopyrimidine deaminase [Dickeya fangzhongdai]KHN55162.1 diaminohydroxyphosphoribosylaminopyrimidine deaminase [Dickeya fangzhongdai]WPD75227.1 NAD-dependent epimerase/dehydratase family protein [Dickeya fangzhongdai]
MLDIDKTKPVMVTGATGYVAGWLVKRLLEEGVTVHAAVRDPNDVRKIGHLNDMAAGKPGTLRFFKADLLEPGSYAEAMKGCGIVFHTASPFKLDIRNPQKELVDPARLGTRNVLETVNKVESVRRVVLTSSCAAIYGDNADIENTPDHILTEEIWNTSSSLEHVPYSYSKTVAERDAWDIATKQLRWDLVVINPSLVIGPGTNPHGTSESFNVVRQLGNGRMKAGIPDIGCGVVDVRDLAEAHLRAAYLPGARGRFIISGHNTSLPEVARALLPKYQAYPIPRRILPKWLVWLVAPLADKSTTRKFVSRNVGYSWQADNNKSIRELMMVYRPLQISIQDMFQQMIDSHQIPGY